LCYVLQAVSAFAQTPSPALLVLNKTRTKWPLLIVGDESRGPRPVGEGPHEVATDGSWPSLPLWLAYAGQHISVIDWRHGKKSSA